MSVPEIVETPLVPYVPGMQPVAVDVPGAAVLTIDGTVYIHRVRLTVHQPEKLLERQSIRLLVATHRTNPRLKAAELIVTGTACRYITADGARFPNNAMVQFSRDPACDPRMAVTKGDLELVLQFDTPGRPALWSFTQPHWMPVTGAISITDPAVPLTVARPALRGEFLDQFKGSHIRLVHLLAAMWQMPFGAAPLILVLVVALMALIGAVLLYPLNLLAADTSPAVAVKAGFGGALVAFGFVLAFAVATPPFQAPDEPNHFLGLLSLAGRSAEAPAAEHWAMGGHFKRIHAKGDERFRPSHAREPEAGSWINVHPTDFGGRSLPIMFWGKALSLIRDWPLPVTFLVIRIMHGLAFSMAVGLGVAVVVRYGALGGRHLVIFPLLLAPTLPFLAMHISNHALLTGAYALLACGIFLLFAARQRSSVTWLLLAGTGASLAISRSALPLVPLAAAAGLALFVPQSPAASPESSVRLSRRASNTGLALGLVVAATLLTSLFVDYPHVPTVHPLAKPDHIPYLLDVLATAFSMRLRDQDFLLVTSFWGAFGWVNRVLPELVVTVLNVLTTTAAVLTLAGVYRRDGLPGVARLGLLVAGAVVSLAAYAVSTLRYSPDIQGRYLVGLYLCMICLAFTDALELGARRRWTSVVLLTILVTGYAAVLVFLLNSYF